jgi:tRNA(Phe) wybutosine-synthesizing methylase Tyw3
MFTKEKKKKKKEAAEKEREQKKKGQFTSLIEEVIKLIDKSKQMYNEIFSDSQ